MLTRLTETVEELMLLRGVKLTEKEMQNIEHRLKRAAQELEIAIEILKEAKECERHSVVNLLRRKAKQQPTTKDKT